MPAPLPPKLKILHGRGGGKDSSGYLVPTPPAFERTAPTAPDWLDSEGADEWDRVVSDLEPLGLLKNSDRAVLVAHCEAWSRFVAAAKCYRDEGVVKLNPDSGRLGKHAAVAVAENAAVQLAKLGGLLGLSPGRRAQSGVVSAARRPVRRVTAQRTVQQSALLSTDAVILRNSPRRSRWRCRRPGPAPARRTPRPATLHVDVRSFDGGFVPSASSPRTFPR